MITPANPHVTTPCEASPISIPKQPFQTCQLANNKRKVSLFDKRSLLIKLEYKLTMTARTNMLRFLAHYPTIKAIPRPTTLVRPRIPPPNIINIYHQKFPSHFNSNLRTNQQGVPNLNSKNPDPMSAANNSAELVYNQDGFISDITQETLQTEIAKTLGIKYLSNATGNNALHSPRSVHGYIHGVGARSIVPFLVFLEGPPLWIFFMFDTGAPQTFITAQV